MISRAPSDLFLTRRDPEAGMARFYALEILPDLFGGAVLCRRWGRIATRGREILRRYDSPEAAGTARDLWLRRKVRRGYIDETLS